MNKEDYHKYFDTLYNLYLDQQFETVDKKEQKGEGEKAPVNDSEGFE